MFYTSFSYDDSKALLCSGGYDATSIVHGMRMLCLALSSCWCPSAPSCLKHIQSHNFTESVYSLFIGWVSDQFVICSSATVAGVGSGSAATRRQRAAMGSLMVRAAPTRCTTPQLITHDASRCSQPHARQRYCLMVERREAPGCTQL